MYCLTCMGRGLIQNDMYHPAVKCIHCNGSGEEKVMSEIEDAEVVKCGSTKEVQKFNQNKYSGLLDVLTKNCVKGKETITFSTEDWDGTREVIKQVEARITELSALTTVTGAVGLCRATVCQWEVLVKMKTKALKDEKKVERLYKEMEYLLNLVDKLITEKVLAADEWWTATSGRIRSGLDDMKRE